jgi:hypothetical protein
MYLKKRSSDFHKISLQKMFLHLLHFFEKYFTMFWNLHKEKFKTVISNDAFSFATFITY